MRRMLYDKGLLTSRDSTRQTLTIRKKIGKAHNEVLHLKASAFCSEEPAENEEQRRKQLARPEGSNLAWSGFHKRLDHDFFKHGKWLQGRGQVGRVFYL